MRSIKTLGIATAVVLALVAIGGASMASASTFRAPGAGAGGETTWNGTRAGANHKLALGGDTFSCSNVSFAGGTIGETPAEAPVTPELASCTWQGFSVAWTTNGCKFRFRANAGGYPAGTVDIFGCTKPMTITSGGCQLEIGNQTGIGTPEYKNTVTESKETLAILANLKGITYTRLGGAGCMVNKPGTFSDGTYSGEWTVKGTRGGSSAPIGIETPAAIKFAVESAPATITGAGTGGSGTVYFKNIGGNTASCGKYSLAGTMATTTTEGLSVVPTYKECSVGGESVPDGYVTAGDCSFVFHLNGTFDIAGTNCATNPITITRVGCIATIGPQSGIASTFAFLNQGGWGALRTLSMSGSSAEKITYTSWGPKCSFQGTASTGKINSAASLAATAQSLWIQ